MSQVEVMVNRRLTMLPSLLLLAVAFFGSSVVLLPAPAYSHAVDSVNQSNGSETKPPPPPPAPAPAAAAVVSYNGPYTPDELYTQPEDLPGILTPEGMYINSSTLEAYEAYDATRYYDLAPWSEWSGCSENCRQRRYRICLGKPAKPTCRGYQQVRPCAGGGSGLCPELRANSTQQQQQQQQQPISSDDTTTSSNSSSSSRRQMPATTADDDGKDARTALLLYQLQSYIYTPWSEWSPCADCRTWRRRFCTKQFVCSKHVEVEFSACLAPSTSDCLKVLPNTELVERIIAEKPAENTTFIQSVEDLSSSSQRVTRKTGGEEAVTSVSGEPAFSCGQLPPERTTTTRTRTTTTIDENRRSWPWIVALLHPNATQFCTGTLIDSSWVLTAAHCVQKPPPHERQQRRQQNAIYVAAGVDDYRTIDAKNYLKASAIFAHPGYQPTRRGGGVGGSSSSSGDSDLALLRLETAVPLSRDALPICLPDRRIPPGTDASLVTWSRIPVEHSHLNDTLRVRDQPAPTVDESVCSIYHRSSASTQTPQAAVVAAGATICVACTNGVSDTYDKDSGGPLLVQDVETARWTVAGVSSAGCGRGLSFGVYSKVYDQMPWIRSVVLGYAAAAAAADGSS